MSLRPQFCDLLRSWRSAACLRALRAPTNTTSKKRSYDEPIDESVESGDDETEFPYKAYINGDSVHVRSGPGQNYYTVLRMKRGEPVYVYRHDPGGWCAIRPPAECFSWISADFVEPGEGRMATVKGDRSSPASAARTATFAT